MSHKMTRWQDGIKAPKHFALPSDLETWHLSSGPLSLICDVAAGSLPTLVNFVLLGCKVHFVLFLFAFGEGRFNMT